jgi:transcriptional regulator with GAF, ATPase, and Fis domain
LRTPTELTRAFEAQRMRLHYVNRAWTVKNYEALLRFFVHMVPRLMEAERCGVFIRDPNSDRVVSKLGTEIGEHEIEAPLDGSIVGHAISTGECVVENTLERRPGFHQEADKQTGFVTRNLVCAPIPSLAGGKPTGAIEVLNKLDGKPFTDDDVALVKEVADYLSLALENILVNEEIIRISDQLDREVSTLRSAFLGDVPFVAESLAMRSVLDLVHMVSSTPVNVLIEGENGTGKELIARMIHNGGDRRSGPFVALNCAAIPETLMESEFFGYEPGAFTGATGSRAGRFEEASGSSLFLDEVGDIPISMQPKFLRAIQEGEGSRLGSNRIMKYDLRLISATNSSLRSLVASGAFREDLYYRLFAVEIRVPPLRERVEDIAPLALAFFDEVCRRYNKTVSGFSNDLLTLFERFSWPGNVRQLRREIERLVALTPEGQHLTPDRCSPEVLASLDAPRAQEANDLSLPNRVRDLELKLIDDALERTGGNRVRAAELLGITRQGLHKKLKRYAEANAEVG